MSNFLRFLAHFCTTLTREHIFGSIIPQRLGLDEHPNFQGMTDWRSFDRRSRSRSFFRDRDRDRRSPFCKRSQDDRDRKNAIAIFLAFYQKSTFYSSNFSKVPGLKNENFEKTFFVALNKHFCK